MTKHLLHRPSDTAVIPQYYCSSRENRTEVSQKKLYNLTVKTYKLFPAKIIKLGLWSKMCPMPTNPSTVLFCNHCQAVNGKFHNVKQKYSRKKSHSPY